MQTMPHDEVENPVVINNVIVLYTLTLILRHLYTWMCLCDYSVLHVRDFLPLCIYIFKPLCA